MYPTQFLGDIPDIPDELLEETDTEEIIIQKGLVWATAYAEGSKHVTDYLEVYWLERLAANRNNTGRTYADLTNRLDFLYDIFNETLPHEKKVTE